MTSAWGLMVWLAAGFVTQAKPAGPAVPAKAEATVAEKTPREQAFERLDQNDNKRLNVDEFLAGSLGKAADTKRKDFKAWDLNHDETLDIEEFRKRGNQPPKKPDPVQQFKHRDKDKDTKLTLDEFLGDRTGEQREKTRQAFHAADANSDGVVTFEEFQASGKGATLTPTQKFRKLDTDEDGKLTETEFLRPKVGKAYYEAGKTNFRKFDLDEDAHLSLDEFKLTPAQKPDAETMFYGLDADGDEKLTAHELIRFLNRDQAYRARVTFSLYDKDKDGFLSLEEYTWREESIESEQRARALKSAFDRWSPWILGFLDCLVVAYFVFAVRRWSRVKRSHRVRSPAGLSQSNPAVARSTRSVDSAVLKRHSAAAASNGNGAEREAVMPESIDEFEVE